MGGTLVNQTSEYVDIQWDGSGQGTLKFKSENEITSIDSLLYSMEILEKSYVYIDLADDTSVSASICLNQSLVF